MKPTFIYLPTDDLDGTVRFYRDDLGLDEAWREAAGVAVERAAATADLRPKVGRARPLAEKSLGTPDAGATSMGMILTAVGDVLAERAGADATTEAHATTEGGAE